MDRFAPCGNSDRRRIQVSAARHRARRERIGQLLPLANLRQPRNVDRLRRNESIAKRDRAVAP